MKQRLRKWILRFIATGSLIAGLLLIIILNPLLTYAGKANYGSCSVFHNKPVDKDWKMCIDQSVQLTAASELYDPKLRLDICLNDGSIYPMLMRSLRGNAFAWGFYDKVVLMGDANCKGNYVTLNGYKWNLAQLLAHEMIHCFQFDKFGLRRSNPAAHIPEWKWEGYPEYIARQNSDQHGLRKNIARLLETEQTDNNGWIQFGDGTGTVIPYYKYWVLMQYCMNIKKMTYAKVLDDTTQESTAMGQMMDWYYKANVPQ